MKSYALSIKEIVKIALAVSGKDKMTLEMWGRLKEAMDSMGFEHTYQEED